MRAWRDIFDSCQTWFWKRLTAQSEDIARKLEADRKAAQCLASARDAQARRERVALQQRLDEERRLRECVARNNSQIFDEALRQAQERSPNAPHAHHVKAAEWAVTLAEANAWRHHDSETLGERVRRGRLSAGGGGHAGPRVQNENQHGTASGAQVCSTAMWDNVVNAWEEDR